MVSELEPNGTPGTATSFSTAEEFLEGSISGISDFDYFKVALSQGQRLTIDTTDLERAFIPRLPPAVEILDGDERILSASYDGRDLAYIAPAAATLQQTLQELEATLRKGA